MKYLGFVLLVLSSSTTIVLAETDTYISLNVGASIVDDEKVVGFTKLPEDGQTITYNYDFGHTISLAAGVVDKDYGFRLEVEVANQINDLVDNDKYEGFDITVPTLLVNVYKDFYIFDNFLGYVGGGVGAAYHDTPDGIDFAYQLGTGLGYELTKEITLNVGYRYLKVNEFAIPRSRWDSPSLEDSVILGIDILSGCDGCSTYFQHYDRTNIHEFGSHNVTAGIRYSF
jgi:opacity protein-like surface antigen